MVMIFSVTGYASRLKQSVSFNLSLEKLQQYVPFTVVAPESFTGQFVRFVHPYNGKSAVAQVIKRRGKRFETNPGLAKAIGINANVARVFIEEVY